jgi:hypothetical protein
VLETRGRDLTSTMEWTMTKAAKAVSRAIATRKSAPLFRLSPLGHKLLAAIHEYYSVSWLNPEGGSMSAELMEDKRYQQAWHRAYDQAWADLRSLIAKVMAAPLSTSNLADRTLIWHMWTDEDDPTDYLPKARRKRDEDFVDHMPALAAVLSMSDIPFRLPSHSYDGNNPPPDAEARVRALLGKHRPKRNALTEAEKQAVASAALAKAEAAAKSVPTAAPFFATA